MVSLTTTEMIHEYIDKHPNATQGDIHKALGGKVSINYIGKIASIYRKKTKQKRTRTRSQATKQKGSTQPQQQAIVPPSADTLDPELRNILEIMQTFTAAGVRVQFNLQDYLVRRGSLTKAEDEIKSQLKTMSLHELTSMILPDKKLPEELLEEK